MSARQRDFDDDRASSSSAAGRGVDYEREDPEMDRSMRRLRWVAAVSLLAGFCSMYLAFCHKPPTEPDAASRPVTPAAVAQSAASQSGAMAGGQSGPTAGAQSTADLPMSNGYRVGPDGRLLQPDQGNLTPPQLPEEAKQQTREGAEVLGRHFVDLLNYAGKTGDVEAVSAITDPSCDDCKGLLEQIDKLYSTGGWVSGDTYVFESYEGSGPFGPEENKGDGWHILMDVDAPEYIAYREGKTQTIRGFKMTFLVDVCAKGSEWKVCNIATQEKDN